MPRYQKLVGKSCYLAPCSEEDAEQWARWENDLRVTVPLGDEAYLPSSVEQARESIRDILRHRQHVFSILDLATDTLIGRTLLFSLDQVNQTAMVGLLIGERDYWGRGYGTEALRLVLDYGFNLLNLHNISLGVFAFNARAIAVYEKVGFKATGRRRQARLIGGRRFDVLLMDILAEEFQSPYVQQLLAP